jgi:hypothetical protein
MVMAGDNRRRTGRKATILAASVAFHVALFFVTFSRASGQLVSAGDAGGGPVGPVFAVTLVPPPTRNAPEADTRETASNGSPFKLRPTPRTDGVPFAQSPRQSAFAALAERLSSSAPTPPPQPRFPADRVQAQGAYVPDDKRLSDARSRMTPTDENTDGPAQGAASTGELWGAIAPCWRNLGFKGQVAVTIDITLDGKGQFRGPPRIVRSSAALLSEPRLKSEANALSALAACLPRANARIAGAQYRLEFPGTP